MVAVCIITVQESQCHKDHTGLRKPKLHIGADHRSAFRPHPPTVWPATAGVKVSPAKTPDRLRSVLIMSDKSSGSSILQNELAKHSQVNLAQWTTHKENETLYWCKAAALLGMPQVGMLDSTVLPMTAARARIELTEFLTMNLPGWSVPASDDRMVFEGWARLCERYAPVFLEKSPHHLHSRSALSLIERAPSATSHEIDIRMIGLIRNPIDTLYSIWQRWRIRPELRQHEWVAAYENLRSLTQRLGGRIIVVRYEDLVTDPSQLVDVCAFLGIDRNQDVGGGIRSDAVSRWHADRTFGFQPDQRVVDLAMSFGYDPEDLSPSRSVLWGMAREAGVARRKLRSLVGRLRQAAIARDPS